MSDLLGLLGTFVPPEAVLDELDPHRRFEQADPRLGARLSAALEAPVTRTVEVMVDVVHEHLVDRVPAATPTVLDAVGAVISRATRLAGTASSVPTSNAS